MYSLETVHNFFSERTMAIVGVSRTGKKFGNVIFDELISKGYKVFPVNPNMENINGERCYSSLKDLPEKVNRVIIVVSPVQTERVVHDVASAGLKWVWLQQGSESEKAIRFCKENNINVISNQCILMFTEPVTSLHRVHRWVWKIIGKYPK